MEDTIVIDSVEKLKVYADPLRQRILQAFCCNPATTKQVAGLLGESPARLYHHIDLLVSAGFLEVVGSQQIRGTVEKYYETVARKIIVDHALVGHLEEGEEAPDAQNLVINTIQAGLVDAMDHFADSLFVGKEKSVFPAVAVQAKVTLSASQAKAFQEKVCEWIDKTSETQDDGESMHYSITVACFPIKITEAAPCCPPNQKQEP